MHQNVSLGSNGVDRVCSLRKTPTRHSGTNFGTSSARFAPSFVRQPSGLEYTQIVLNHQNISLGSNMVDRVRSFQKIPTRLHGTNFCTSSARFAPIFVRLPNGAECTQIVRSAQKHQFRVQWGWIGCVRCEKFRCDFMAQTCALIAPFQPVFHRVSSINETL